MTTYKLTSKKTDYMVTLHPSNRFTTEQRTGYPLKYDKLPGLDFFVGKGDFDQWQITEKISGRHGGEGSDTRKEAISSFIKKVELIGYDTFIKNVKEAHH